MRYFELLQKFKNQDLDFFCFAKLSETDQIGFAAELLLLARFEPQLIGCAIATVQDVVPVLPADVRLDLVRAMCSLIDDFHLYDGKDTYAFLHPLLVLALTPPERLGLATHFAAQLKPDHVSRASAALGALTRLLSDLAPAERKAAFAEILNFAKTRTLPDTEMQSALFEIFVSNRSDGFGMVLACLATMLLNQKDPAYLLLQLGFFEKIFGELAPPQRKHLLQDLHFLTTNAYRTVVNAVLRFYQTALARLAIEDRGNVLQLLLALPEGAAYHYDLREIFALYRADLPSAAPQPDSDRPRRDAEPARLALRLTVSED